MSNENIDPAWSLYSGLADAEVVELAQRGEEAAVTNTAAWCRPASGRTLPAARRGRI
jgi:hypothetical protein